MDIFTPEFVLEIVYGIVALVVFAVTLFRTGSIKKSLSQLQEVEKMKCDTFDDKRLKQNEYAQTFDTEKTQYVYNSQTKELEELPTKIDIQAEINKGMTTALENVLEKFIPSNPNNKESDDVLDFTQSFEDLAVIGETFDILEEYREKLHLPDTMSYSDIQSHILDLYKRQRAAYLKSHTVKSGDSSVDKKDGG